MELKIKDLTKQYANKKAINHITCTLTGITGLLGANGAGKKYIDEDDLRSYETN